jgi:hypothetical protein
MDNEGSLLQLFDRAGLSPSVQYTEDFINKHKRQVSRYLIARDPFKFKIRENGKEIDYVYALNSVYDAIDRIRRIIKIDGLAFYPVSESWESHWNPLAFGKEWKDPIPDWGKYLEMFNNDRLMRTKQIIKVSAISEYEKRVSLASQQDKIERLQEELCECQKRSDSLQREVDVRDGMLANLKKASDSDAVEKQMKILAVFKEMETSIEENKSLCTKLREDCHRYQEQRNQYQDQRDECNYELQHAQGQMTALVLAINEADAEKNQLSNTCDELQAECDRLQLELRQVQAERDAFKATEEQRQQTIKEINDTKDLASLQQEHERLSSLKTQIRGLARERRNRMARLRTKMDRWGQELVVALKREERGDALLSVLEDESRVYEEMDVDKDGDRDGDGNGDEVSYMDGDTAVSSHDDLDDIPELSPQGGRPRPGRQPTPTRRKTDSGKARVKLGHINNRDRETGRVDKVEVWAGIDKGGKLYRRCTPLGKDGKSGKTSVKHSEIVYLPEFQNLEQDSVDVLIRAEVGRLRG